MIGMRLVDVFFQMNPAFHYGDPSFPIKDILVHACVLTGFGAIYFWYFAGQLKKLPLLPSQQTMHLMAKAAVTVYETAVENQHRDN